MRAFLPATLLTGALLCAASFAQSAPSAQNPSGPPEQPQAQPATPSPAQPEAQPQPQAAPQATQAPASAPTAANQAQAAGVHRIAPGSVIPVQLTKTIDAKKAKPGDQVAAKVTMDLKANSGEVVVPKDTVVIGHVTEAQTRSKEQKESQVGIAFDRAVLKDGEISLPMSIQAVIAPPNNNANNGGASESGAPATGGGTATSPMGGGGRSGSQGGAAQTSPSSTTPNAVPKEGTNASQEGGARPPINGSTQGVVGISNLKLEPAQTAAQGSVLSSEKNNVKVESGTMLLLKVNQ
jgi:hypothetical protein